MDIALSGYHCTAFFVDEDYFISQGVGVDIHKTGFSSQGRARLRVFTCHNGAEEHAI